MDHPEIVYAVAQHLHHRELQRLAWSSTAIKTTLDQAIPNHYFDKQILLFSGFGSVVDEVELLNPATGEVETLPPLPVHRSSPSIIVLGCSAFVCGGCDQSGRATDGVDHLDIVSMRWTPASAMSTPRTMAVAGVLQDTVYVGGGADSDSLWEGGRVWRSVQKYDFANNKWIDMPAMIDSRVGAAAIVFKGCMYVFGGETKDGQSIRTLKTVERLDPAIGHWQSLPPMSEWRHFHTTQDVSIAAVGDHLYVLDGMLGDTQDLVLERLDTKTLTWESLRSPPVMCHRTALVACCGYLYACGGASVEEIDDDDYPVHDMTNTEIQRFDPRSGEWDVAANMMWMRSGCVALASAGFLYVLGGDLSYLGSSEDRLALVECFDTEAYQRWTLCSSKVDFDSNLRRRGILGSCVCSTLPNASVHVGKLWNDVALKFRLKMPDGVEELPHTGIHSSFPFKKLFYNSYAQACESRQRNGAELNTLLMQGVVALVLCKAWRQYQLGDIHLNARNIQRLVDILMPIVMAFYDEWCQEIASKS